MWRTATLDRGWHYPDDWWVPAVDAVVESALDGDDLTEGCRRLGVARAHAGVSMKETLDDIRALGLLIRSLGTHPVTGAAQRQIDLLDAVCATAEGWADSTDATTATTDPLTRLVDADYLGSRLAEVFQAAEYAGQRPAITHALVVVSLVPAAHPAAAAAAPSTADGMRGLIAASDRWEKVHQVATLAQEVQRVFARGETVAMLGPSTVVVLTPRSPDLVGRVNALRELLEARNPGPPAQAPPVVGVWVEGLPDTLCNAQQLIRELRR